MKRFLVDNLKNNSLLIQNAIALGEILFFFFIGYLSVQHQSVTIDESNHYKYGNNIWNGDSSRFDDSSMPVSALNALPVKILSLLFTNSTFILYNDIFLARLVTVIISAAIAFLVYKWARLINGDIAALFCLLLYVLDPNIIAHSQLITTDIYVAGAVTFTFYRLWLFARSRTRKNGLWFFVALGISQLAKYTAITLYPLAFLALFLYDLPEIIKYYPKQKILLVFTKKYIGFVCMLIIISLLIINIGFLFDRTLTHFGDYQFRSEFLSRVQKKATLLQDVPVPVPYPYLEGLDWMRHTQQTGDRFGHLYLLGKSSKLDGFPGYYMIASLFKVPISIQIFFLSFLIFYFSKKNWIENLRDDVFFLTPIIFFIIYYNFFFNAQIGNSILPDLFPAPVYIYEQNVY